MQNELPERTLLRFTQMELPPEQLLPLVESVREAFHLSRRGYAALGYVRLRAAQDRAASSLDPEHPCGLELLLCWDRAVKWYERFAAPPPH